MLDSSHDKARPAAGLDAARGQCLNRDFFDRVGVAERATKWRGWVERAGSVARAPMWTSREGWLSALGQWARSPSFAACAAAARVSMAPVTLLAVAAVMAEHADHATGRHVAVTRATIAEKVGCSPDTVTAAWRLLRVARWVVEAQRGHGSPGTPAAGRRPSVYHLVPRQQPPTPQVQEAPTNSVRTKKSGDNPDLPPKAGIGLLTPEGSNSPSAHARPKKSPITDPAAVRRYRAAPRPLPVQRLAAELVARTHGLHRGHIGAVCDAITTAGIDPATWTARAITHALDTDMKTRGWTWPDRIDHPGAFLASRFKRLDWQPEDGPPSTKAAAVPPPARTRAEREAVTLPVYVPQAPMVLTDAQQARITTARAAIREILDRRVRPESALALTRHTRTANRHNQRPPHV